MMMNSTTEQHADAIVKNHTNSTDDSPSLAGTLSPDTSYEVSPTKNTAPVDDDIEQPTRQRFDKKDDYEVTSPKRKSRLWWCILVIAIALIIIAIPLAIAFSRPQATSGSSSNNNAMGSTPSPNAATNSHGSPTAKVGGSHAPVAPSQAPLSAAPTMASPMQVALASLIPQALLANTSSVQYKAYKWLKKSEMAYSSVANTTSGPIDWRQRYALTVLDLSLAAPNSIAPPHGNNLTHECYWSGVTCFNMTNTTANASATNVETVVWASQSLVGTIPSEISMLEHVTMLDLGENAIGGTIPEAIWNMTKLQFLYLHDNRFSGTLSEGIGNLQQLQNFYASKNKLTGKLPQGLASKPSAFGTHRPLKWLTLQNNSFTGTIPHHLNLYHLYYLDLGHNQLTGTVPADWLDYANGLVALRHLYLDHNKFTGSLPSNFTSTLGTGRLFELYLSDNQFTGTVPGGVPDPLLMLQIEIQNNHFTAIDSSLCSLIIWNGGQVVNFRMDCKICTCNYMCNLCF